MTISEKRITEISRIVEILSFVSIRQKANQRTTKAEVIRHMRGMSAVNTTHGLIMDLIREGKLNVEKLNSQVHFLTVSKEFTFEGMQDELLRSHIEEVLKQIELEYTNKINIEITKKPSSGYTIKVKHKKITAEKATKE